MDLDRLHYDYMAKLGYQSGRTYDMLVTVVQHADFGVSPILIKVAGHREFRRLMSMIVMIANDMGYHTRVLTQSRIMVNDIEIVFSVGIEEPLGLHPAKAYEDHYVLDSVYEQMRIRSFARG